MPRHKLPPREFSWTPKLAYITGLLATDGCLSNDHRHIIMRSSDPDLLKVFRDCLSIKNKIGKTTKNGYTNKPSFRVQFGNVQFFNWLCTIGISPAKTHSIGKINIPDQYFRDFLRGHLDGDGSIFTYKDTYNFYKRRNYINQRLYTQFISVSETHIRWLYKKIQELTGLKGALIKSKIRKESSTIMWKIKFAKKESIKLLGWIYYEANLPCLRRKRHLAECAIKQVLAIQRRPYAKINSFN